MREKLTSSANEALKNFHIGPNLSDGFKALFTQKIGALADHEKVTDASLKAYLIHSSKLEGVPAYVDADLKDPNDVLLTDLSTKVLNSMTKKGVVDTDIDLDNEVAAKKLVNQMDEALNDEFAKVGALQSVRHAVADKTEEVTNSSHIIENYVLGGRTNVTDVPDNLLMTPIGRVTKLLYYIMPSNNGMTSAYAAINYVFFAAMFFYVLQLPALAIYRLYRQKTGQAKKAPLLDKFEIFFGILGISITALVGAATFMTVFHPFVIAVFSIAFVAHSINLVLLGLKRRETRKKYEESLAQIETSRQEIETLKKKRATLYAQKAAVGDIKQINQKIYEATTKLQTVVEAHHQIRLEHEQAHNRTRLKIGVAAVIVAACVLAFFILSSPICPPTLIPALAVLAFLGMVGAGLVLFKSVNQFHREKKSRRANEVEVDIALENEYDLADEEKNKASVAHDFKMGEHIMEDSRVPEEQQQLIEVAAPKETPRISADNLVKLSGHSSGLFSRKTSEGHHEKTKSKVSGLMWQREKQTEQIIRNAKNAPHQAAMRRA